MIECTANLDRPNLCLPSYRIEPADLPPNFNQISLLCLTARDSSRLQKAGMRSVTQVIDAIQKDRLCDSRNIGPISEEKIYQKIIDFGSILKQFASKEITYDGIGVEGSEGAEKTVVINPKAWFRFRAHTWRGLPKTPEIILAETLIGDLGDYLEGQVRIKRLRPQIARTLSEDTNGVIPNTETTVESLLNAYNITPYIRTVIRSFSRYQTPVDLASMWDIGNLPCALRVTNGATNGSAQH